MITTLDMTVDVASDDIATLDEASLSAEGEEAAALDYRASDGFFGDETACAADVCFVRRLSLIAVPALLLICLLTLALARAS